jgi:hypothetical protein
MIAKKAVCGLACAMLASTALAACGTIYSSGPQQVHANNPSVTYSYSNDQELLLATDKASTFCSQYQSTTLRSGTIMSNPDGTNSVVFECVPLNPTATTVAMAPVPTAPMTYRYMTAQELLTASQNAEAYCMRYGKRSNAAITSNADGSKTASFQCVP